MHDSTGILRYSNDPYKLILEVDQGISDYYRWFVPKSVRLNKQMYPAHISVVRKELPKNLEFWAKYQGQEISFQYSNIVHWGNVYYWLNAYSDELVRIRLELGLPDATNLTRPPDGEPCFHITIGNLKRLS